jgi:predicted GNAT family N-acyltransferase
MQITIYQADFKTDFMAIRLIRETVFVHEQNVPIEMEWDEFDKQAIHILAEVQGQAIGTVRLLNDGSIGRVAVLKAWRKQGVGCKMMRYLMDIAKQHHSKIHLHAQIDALDFYQKLGFVAMGNTFYEAGMLHQTTIYHF